ncbi:MAG: hypothetical protein K0R54_4149 [Clostridiaceae bacterium]|jgi:hypothetical protein|nr:hypothetical protein [Clostridiaceae bacterium]
MTKSKNIKVLTEEQAEEKILEIISESQYKKAKQVPQK